VAICVNREKSLCVRINGQLPWKKRVGNNNEIFALFIRLAKMTIVPHPDFMTLQNDCKILQNELAALIAQFDQLKSTIIPNIEAEYQLTIGHLEYERFCLQIESNRLKRKIEIIQAAVNHGDLVSEDSIDKMLDHEFEEWGNKLNEHLKKIKNAKTRAKSKLSLEESKEIAELYRKIVKKIHPDINHELFNQYKDLWFRVAEAYNHGQLESLKAAWLIIQDLAEENQEVLNLDALSQRKEELKSNIISFLAEINEIKAAHPYDLMENLSDESWIKEQQSTLYKSIAELSSHKIRLKVYLEQMLEDSK